MHCYAIGLGSNVGDRFYYLSQALSMLDRLDGIQLLGTSRLYESQGWGRDDLKPFLNAAVVATGSLPPVELLRKMMKIEDTLGRQRSLKWGPRTLDLDLLACDDIVMDTEELQLPHPWISRRPFVYQPLADLMEAHPAWPSLVVPHPEGLAIEGDSRPLTEGTSVWGTGLLIDTQSPTIVTYSEEETQQLGSNLAAYLRPRDIVTLEAPVGAGKSVFARGIARGLGITERIQSPSYTLCREYDHRHGTLQHWDFYRLESLDDLESTGFTEETDAIRMIEWPEQFPEEYGRPFLAIRIEIEPSGARRLSITAPKPAPFCARAIFQSEKVNHS